MQLTAGAIGMVPENGPGRMGVIGMPAWMWIQNPGETTTGPITRTASQGGVTVTATGKVDRIVWSMGDGHTVTCHGAGTVYEDRYGTSDSPTCGYRYTKQGDYTVTATTYWTITWSGGGQSGTETTNNVNSRSVSVAEWQVVITDR